jgi:hypothetical protein
MLDRGTVRGILDEIEAAVKEVAARHGLEFDRQRASYTASEMTTRISLRTREAAGAMADFQRKQFPVLAERFGLPADAVGKSFIFKGAQYTIEGLKVERPKYPVVCRRMDGRPFKFGVLCVKNALEREAGQRLSSGLR